MQPSREDLERLYATMARIRAVERATAALWRDGLVSGELHLGVGEEAAVAAVFAHVHLDDAVSVDYRSTAAFVARGVSVELLLLEMVGDAAGLCGGRAGHMHLMSPEHLITSTGIVGASAPVACGLAYAAQLERPGSVAVAFFGDGAVNEGMVAEAMNFAVAWSLPLLFVCKDNGWAVTTRSRAVTGGTLRRRGRGFGLRVICADGRDPVSTWRRAERAVSRARGGRPVLLVVRVDRPEGHFMDDPLQRIATAARELARESAELLGAARARPGASLRHRLSALSSVTGTLALAALQGRRKRRDPLDALRRRLDAETVRWLDQAAEREVAAAVAAVATHREEVRTDG